MKRAIINLLKSTFLQVAGNTSVMLIIVAMLLIPPIATVSQFISSSFINNKIPVLLFFWPGSQINVSVNMPVWLITGIILAIYGAGIIYLFKRRTLGETAIVIVLSFVASGLIGRITGLLTGLSEKQMPDLTGKANACILSLWHNPVWEEAIFRGIPLMLLLLSDHITGKRTKTGVALYFIIPAVAFGFYHIPGHGFYRFPDTLILSLVFSWITLKYSFFAAIVMHCYADAMMVSNLARVPSVQASEIPWLMNNYNTLNSLTALTFLFLILLIPALWIHYYRKEKRYYLQAINESV